MKLASPRKTNHIDPRTCLVLIALMSPPVQAGCLSLDPGSAHTGGISTESATLVNTCSYKVDYLYCIQSANGGGFMGCASNGGSTGGWWVAPHGRSAISISGASLPFKVYVAECKYGDQRLENVVWTGNRLTWNCRDLAAERREREAEQSRRQAEQERRQAEQDAREERARLEAQQAQQRREWEALEQRQRDHAERARRQYEELRRAEEEKQRRLREQQARAYQQGQNFLNTLARIQEAEDARREAEVEREEAERAQRRARETARQQEAWEAQRRQEEERRRQEELARQKDALARQGLDNPFESGARPSQAKAVANPFDTPVPGSAPMKLAQANPFDDPPSGGNPFAAPASAESGCARDIRLWQENHSTRRFDAACEEHRHAERKYAAGAELYRRCPSHDAGGRLAAEYARKRAEARAALTAGCPAEP